MSTTNTLHLVIIVDDGQAPWKILRVYKDLKRIFLIKTEIF